MAVAVCLSSRDSPMVLINAHAHHIYHPRVLVAPLNTCNISKKRSV